MSSFALVLLVKIGGGVVGGAKVVNLSVTFVDPTVNPSVVAIAVISWVNNPAAADSDIKYMHLPCKARHTATIQQFNNQQATWQWQTALPSTCKDYSIKANHKQQEQARILCCLIQQQFPATANWQVDCQSKEKWVAKPTRNILSIQTIQFHWKPTAPNIQIIEVQK